MIKQSVTQKENGTETTETNNSNLPFEIIEVENTPFRVVSTPDGYHEMLGKYRTSEKTTTEIAKAKKEAKTINWNKIIQLLEYRIELLTKDLETKWTDKQ